VYVSNWFQNCEVVPELPSIQGWVEAMMSLGRLIFFDQPGTGASDPITPAALPTLEQWSDSITAVLDDLGSREAVLLRDAQVPVARVARLREHCGSVSRGAGRVSVSCNQLKQSVLRVFDATVHTGRPASKGYLATWPSADPPVDRENLVAQPAGTVALGSCAARCRRSTRPDAPIAEIAM
jgi:hypothetical protein